MLLLLQTQLTHSLPFNALSLHFPLSPSKELLSILLSLPHSLPFVFLDFP